MCLKAWGDIGFPPDLYLNPDASVNRNTGPLNPTSCSDGWTPATLSTRLGSITTILMLGLL